MTTRATTKATHVMAPPEQCAKLRLLSRVTRVHQSEYLREVSRHVLAVYAGDTPLALPPGYDPTVRLESIVFRLPAEDIEALKWLSARTRVRRSEYLRVGLAAVLARYDSIITKAEETGRAA